MFHRWFKLVVSVPGQCEASRHQYLRSSAPTNTREALTVLSLAGVWSRRYSVASIGQRGFQSGDAGFAGTGGTPSIDGRARLDRAPRVRVRPRAEAAYSWPVEARYFFKFRQWLYQPLTLTNRVGLDLAQSGGVGWGGCRRISAAAPVGSRHAQHGYAVQSGHGLRVRCEPRASGESAFRLFGNGDHAVAAGFL